MMNVSYERTKQKQFKGAACVVGIVDGSLSPPSLSSVVVLYTQGVECKQWREVRDRLRLSVTTTHFNQMLRISQSCEIDRLRTMTSVIKQRPG